MRWHATMGSTLPRIPAQQRHGEQQPTELRMLKGNDVTNPAPSAHDLHTQSVVNVRPNLLGFHDLRNISGGTIPLYHHLRQICGSIQQQGAGMLLPYGVTLPWKMHRKCKVVQNAVQSITHFPGQPRVRMMLCNNVFLKIWFFAKHDFGFS